MLQDAENILEVDDLEVAFGGTPVLHRISFAMRRGERDRDEDTLAHAARELVRVLAVPALRVRDAGLGEQGDRTPFDVGAVELAVRTEVTAAGDDGVGDLRADLHGGVEVGHRVLRDEPDAPAVAGPDAADAA